jgi:NADPH:quinone reductase-like Zn-dependent oxidoreductase
MSEPRNRVVQVRRFGGPEGLEVADAPLPTAGPGEVRVRVLASGLEYVDRRERPRKIGGRSAGSEKP